MSFLRKLFGGGSGSSARPVAELDHEGFHIATTPIAESGQFRLAATISREVDGVVRSHRLIRADLFMTQEDASEAAIRKAKQLIREQGEAFLDSGPH